MKKISIVYWTSTGNTEIMAKGIYDGVIHVSDVVLKNVSEASPEDLEHGDIIFLGGSAMGVEEVDDSEMMPFIEEHQSLLVGKKVILFGSYDWGDGEWLENWKLKMLEMNIEIDRLFKLNNTPDENGLYECHKLGKEYLKH